MTITKCVRLEDSVKYIGLLVRQMMIQLAFKGGQKKQNH